MPKRIFKGVTLPVKQPDCCAECPLLGILPQNFERPKNSKKTHLCIGTGQAISRRGTKVRASEKDDHHPLRRPCDDMWPLWVQLPHRQLSIKEEYYLKYRLPYITVKDMVIKF